MTIENFYEYVDNEVCPVCNGREFSTFQNANGLTLYYCKNCEGVPSFCRNSIYVSRTADINYFNNGSCANCGEHSASASDHAYLCRWS